MVYSPQVIYLIQRNFTSDSDCLERIVLGMALQIAADEIVRDESFLLVREAGRRVSTPLTFSFFLTT